VSPGTNDTGEGNSSLKTSRVKSLHLESLALQLAVVSQSLEVLHAGHLLNEILVSLAEPLEVSALNTKGKLLVLINGPVLHLVHLVKLSFEENKLLAEVALSVNKTVLELLEGVDHLEEIVLLQEEVKVLSLGLSNDGLSREQQGILVEVLLQGSV